MSFFALFAEIGFAEVQDQDLLSALQEYELDKTEAGLSAMKVLGEAGDKHAQSFRSLDTAFR